jgi:CheY-like chemotaxis protein
MRRMLFFDGHRAIRAFPVTGEYRLPNVYPRKSNDHCDLALIDPDTGEKYATLGRLYQHDSLAWKEPALLGELPEYRHTTELPAVYVKHARSEGQGKLWFVHERWGVRNPWDELVLQEDDLVYGTVSSEVVAKRTGEVAGYLVQLDETGSLLTLDGDEDTKGRLQPDIEVFIPVAELPWEDGSVGGLPARRDMKHKPLAKGESIQAALLDIRCPPENPRASVNHLIHYRDAHCQAIRDRQETSAQLRFRLLWGARRDTATEEVPQHPPLQEARLLLVDDDERTLAAYAELYRLNGAEVETVLVERDRFNAACTRVAELSREAAFDLVIVDNNLPGKDLGERLIELVARRFAGKPLPRCLLLTANPLDAQTTPAKRERLQNLGVVGFLHRPLSHDHLMRLFDGEAIWEENVAQAASSIKSARTRDAEQTVEALLADIAALPEVRFAMLLRIDPDLPASDLLVAGDAPFIHADLKKVLASTDLHLLASGRVGDLHLKADDGGNAQLRASRGGPALWEAFEVDGERWILGVGHARNWEPTALWPWWCKALIARLDARGWLASAQQSSNFVELGMAHQGLSHEVFNLRNEMDALLTSGETWLRQPTRNPSFLPGWLASLRRAHVDTLALAEHLLEGLTKRQTHVYLPSALATIRVIVGAECAAKNLALDLGPAPPIALPIPSAAFVLPVVNLLLNAAKHHYRQDNRRVSLLLDVERGQGRAWLHADVRDNGPGLSLAARARLWQAGHSFAAETRERHGMGLWLSRRLALEAGGRLECIEDWRYLGSHFRLSFPIEL